MIQELMQEEPDEPFHRYALGLEYRNYEPEKAIKIWEDLVAVSPDYLPVYYPLAELLGDESRFEAGLEYCEKGIKVATLQGVQKTLGELKNLKTNLDMELL